MIRNQKAFTLVEMMIVLLIISILLIITIPNVVKHNSNINKKGCEAYLKMVEGQVQAFEIEFKKIPTVQELITEHYINSDKCPSGKKVSISVTGDVSVTE